MKKCPQCGRDYDLSMSFCLDDGSELLYAPGTPVANDDGPATAILSEPGAVATGFRGREEKNPTADKYDRPNRYLPARSGGGACRYLSSSSLAIAYGSLGEKDKAFAFLDKDVADRASRPQVFSINPLWDDLRDDPSFADLIRRVEAAKMD